jgi:hypothetical protein
MFLFVFRGQRGALDSSAFLLFFDGKPLLSHSLRRRGGISRIVFSNLYHVSGFGFSESQRVNLLFT